MWEHRTRGSDPSEAETPEAVAEEPLPEEVPVRPKPKRAAAKPKAAPERKDAPVNLKAKHTCGRCGKTMSLHTALYSHECPDEARIDGGPYYNCDASSSSWCFKLL